MNDFFNFADHLVEAAKQNYKTINRGKAKRKYDKWKACAALLAAGYTSNKCEKEDNNDLTFTWNKEGEKEIKVRLSFIDQQLWLEYLTLKAAKEKNNGEQEQT